ncbi:NAD(P)H-dependent oxidoreductase subunit E [Lutimonas vermicola]|uniref:NAD(P)H-dependent oxidoreductase subunit E n=1 Tax=Lutimonas vermicola TaxID=414288 RepID=A0ABU9L1I9_9FLAO
MAALQTPPPKSSLMNILWDIQRKRRYIAPDDMTKIANEFRISRIELEGIISFYHFFHRSHAGNYTIYLNNGIISKHGNYAAVKRAFEKELDISCGETTTDKMFGLFETSCIGLSDQETSALINFHAFTDLTPAKVKNILGQLRKGEMPETLTGIPKNNIQYTPKKDKTVFFKPYTAGVGLKKLKKLSPDQLIELVKKSKLSGRGGAFFPTGMKWEFCKNNSSDQKFIICNADEGEPGTFKDRVLMNKYPGLMIEGMAMAAYAVGANFGYVYLRAEYYYLKDKIEKEIKNFRSKGLLGKNILGIAGFDFDIVVHLGAGAYVCGEETALISSIEGKRGEPSTKEYFPVERGLFGKPTIINNVETLCAVPRILSMSLAKYLKIGTEATKGTKLISVSGDCKKPGIYEIEWGMKLKQFLKLIKAKNPYMILFNGYAGECLSSADFDREISGENLLAEHVQFKWDDPIEYARKMSAIGLRSGGSFMVFNDQRDLMPIFENITNFFVSESCGICAPCRTGNFLLSKKLKKIMLCHAEKSDLEDLEKWSSIIKQSSRCGLGKTSTNYLLSAMLKFPQEFNKCLLARSDFNKSFEFEKVTQDYDTIINEIEKVHG